MTSSFRVIWIPTIKNNKDNKNLELCTLEQNDSKRRLNGGVSLKHTSQLPPFGEELRLDDLGIELPLELNRRRILALIWMSNGKAFISTYTWSVCRFVHIHLDWIAQVQRGVPHPQYQYFPYRVGLWDRAVVRGVCFQLQHHEERRVGPTDYWVSASYIVGALRHVLGCYCLHLEQATDVWYILERQWWKPGVLFRRDLNELGSALILQDFQTCDAWDLTLADDR